MPWYISAALVIKVLIILLVVYTWYTLHRFYRDMDSKLKPLPAEPHDVQDDRQNSTQDDVNKDE